MLSRFVVGCLVIAAAGLFLVKPEFLIFIFPGCLLAFHPQTHKMSLLELLTTVVVMSLASTIVGFGLLKFVPLPFTVLIRLIAVISLGAGVWLARHHPIKVNLTRSDLIPLALFAILVLVLGGVYFKQLVPSGTDMATHSYIAVVIKHYNAFPQTYEPIVPLDDFGFEPIGLPSLMAGWSLFSRLPIYRTGLLFSLGVYPVAGLVFYFFLKKFFSPWIAGLTTVALFFIGTDFTSYLGWGAHPTVASTVLIVAVWSWMVLVFRARAFTAVNGVILAALWVAAFLTHPSPMLAGAYLMVCTIGASLIHFGRRPDFRRFLIAQVVFSFIFGLCFLVSIQPLSARTVEWLQRFQRHHQYVSLVTDSLFSFKPTYLFRDSGVTWSWLIFVGAFLVIRRRRVEDTWFLWAFLIYGVLLLNTVYWFLPLSAALYPDRVTTAASFIFCYLVATTLEFGNETLIGIVKNQSTRLGEVGAVMLILTLMLLLSGPAWSLVNTNYVTIKQLVSEEVFVTPDDLAAFEWLKVNTTESDVIENNYGDAGIWIPAMARRRVTDNDAMPHSFDRLRAAQAELKPTYAFIGSNPQYPDQIYLTSERAASLGYELVFQAGDSRIYKINPS